MINYLNFKEKIFKKNYESSEKLISHLGYDKNAYISFDMYRDDEIFGI